MSQLMQAEITGHSSPASGVYMIELFSPEVAAGARPGQFLHIRCGEPGVHLLRRPISIHAVNRNAGLVRIMFQVAGRGTALLAQKQDGLLDIMGPLGHGFTLNQARHKDKNPTLAESSGGRDQPGSIIVAGGGIGAAPLFFLLQELAATEAAPRVKVLLGAARAALLLTVEQAVALGFGVQIATDDGSAGFPGLVTYLLAEELRHKTDFVYACGPAPMLRTVCTLLERAGTPGEVSLEERMACGVGACLSCVCRVRPAGGSELHQRVCVDGPVFSAAEVAW
ncbi:MAG: dihydroorotate dehydrogenase electron transfer subunit [Firmicutes bacterium]|nr:dihydroorotate dehydrogenase electron transfer subunit [Bacillota bacterium]